MEHPRPLGTNPHSSSHRRLLPSPGPGHPALRDVAFIPRSLSRSKRIADPPLTVPPAISCSAGWGRKDHWEQGEAVPGRKDLLRREGTARRLARPGDVESHWQRKGAKERGCSLRELIGQLRRGGTWQAAPNQRNPRFVSVEMETPGTHPGSTEGNLFKTIKNTT